MGRLFDYTVFPLLLPLVLVWLLVARILSLVSPFLVFPSVLLAKRLYWSIPFIQDIYKQRGAVSGFFLRVGFEVNYCMNVVRRFLTLPLRPHLPEFYIVGFPKCGTTSLATYLRQHPAISGLDGLQCHETLSKESHFFNGALGRGTTSSKALYRSYFPTVLTRWWKERVLRVGKFICFDACPLPACLPYTAKRMAKITPNAKLIFMLRDPVQGAFSAEIMFRNLGMPLNWSLMEDVQASDPRFFETPDQERYWKQVEDLGADEPLPEDLMRSFYYNCGSILRCGKYADRIAPFLEHFPRENLMFIDFYEFTRNTEPVLKKVFQFIDADPSLYTFNKLPPGMQGERRGRRMHPSVKRKLQQYYMESNYRLYSLLGRDFHWCDPEVPQALAPEPHAPVEATAVVAAEASASSSSSGRRRSSSVQEEGGCTSSSGGNGAGKARSASQGKGTVDLFEAIGVAGGRKGGIPCRLSSEGSLDGGIKSVPGPAMAAV